MKLRPFLARLGGDCSGSMIIEFAILGPAFLVMLFGVLQVGIALQNYNALRNISADVARFAMVQHQSGNKVSNSQIRTFAMTNATGAPYLLRSARVDAVVNDAATQRVTGAKELDLRMAYQIDSLLEFAGIEGPYITYRRPIFLLDESTP